MSNVYEDDKGQWRLQWNGEVFGPFATRSLADLLEQRKAETISQAEYEATKAQILADELGIGVAATIAPAPAAPKASITVEAKDREAEAQRIRDTIDAARKAGRLESHLPKPVARPTMVRASVPVLVNGQIDHYRLLTEEEIAAKVAEQATKAAAQEIVRSVPSAMGPTVEIPNGYEVRGGIIQPIAKAPTPDDPIVAAVRERFKAREFGDPKSPTAQAKAREEIKRLRAEKPQGSRKVCPVCNGNPNKITGKLCLCEGKGSLGITTPERYEASVDAAPRNPEEVTYVAYLASGGSTTIYADNGTKAVRGACDSLRSAATGFDRVELQGGVALYFRQYQTLCPACHGTRKAEGRTCTQCEDGRVTKVGGRFWFGDACGVCKGQRFTLSEDKSEAKPCKACNETGQNGTPAADRAHEAGLQATMGYDGNRTCGRKKCKGPECRACRDAKQGGWQRPGYVRCGECRGTGKIQGVDHEKCRGKGYFTVTEFIWIDSDLHDCPKCAVKDEINPLCDDCHGHGLLAAFGVSSVITRKAVLTDDRPAKRDRNITKIIGYDQETGDPITVEVGAGAIPSRKSGSIMHLTGTARNKYDTAQKVYGSQEIRKGRDGKTAWTHRQNQGVRFTGRARDDHSTFSDG